MAGKQSDWDNGIYRTLAEIPQIQKKKVPMSKNTKSAITIMIASVLTAAYIFGGVVLNHYVIEGLMPYSAVASVFIVLVLTIGTWWAAEQLDN